MKELKPRITENGIEYVLVGDYYIPDLKLPEENRPIGKYGQMHREYLKEQCYRKSSNPRSAENPAPLMPPISARSCASKRYGQTRLCPIR